MTSIRLLFLFILSVNSQHIFLCDFDYGFSCISDLPLASFIIINETNDEPRQPASDVTAIGTSHNDEECFFPFSIGSFQMYFCEKTDPDLPATCPTFNATGPRINCSQGEYGYEKFEVEEIGSRSYKLEELPNFETGEHCFEFYYYLSDENSNASIEIILEDSQSNMNTTIITASSRSQNRWYQIRQGFYLYNENPTIYIVFERKSSSDMLPFFIAIDQITIIDLECGPDIINTTETSPTTTESTISTSLPTTTSSLSTTATISSSLSSTTIIPTTSTSQISSSRTSLTSRTTSTTRSMITSTTTRTTSTTTRFMITSTTTRTTTISTLSSTKAETSTITRMTTLSTLTLDLTTSTTTNEPSLSIKIPSNILLIILILFFII